MTTAPVPTTAAATKPLPYAYIIDIKSDWVTFTHYTTINYLIDSVGLSITKPKLLQFLCPTKEDETFNSTTTEWC
jgi:hypothetical protein